MPDRNAWLRLDDAALLRQGHEERHRASGPGGQRRNKVETAVKLRHGPSGVEVKANESRSLEENRRRAVRRLRERIAVEVRAPFDLAAPALPPEFLAQRAKDGSLRAKQSNPVYPIVVGTLLDALAAADGSYARAATALGITTSQLLRFLKSDAEVWRKVTELRTKAE